MILSRGADKNVLETRVASQKGDGLPTRGLGDLSHKAGRSLEGEPWRYAGLDVDRGARNSGSADNGRAGALRAGAMTDRGHEESVPVP
jgi:hypothetical protein